MEKNIKVKYEGQDVEVLLGEITWKDKKDCIKKSMRMVPNGRSQRKEIDSILQKELMMLKSIKNTPFPLEISSLDSLSSRDGERLYKAYAELNDYEDDEEGEQ